MASTPSGHLGARPDRAVVSSFEAQVKQALKFPLEQRVDVLRRGGSMASRALTSIAFDRHESLSVRWKAVTTMGRWDADRFRSQLEKALQSRQWFMRNAALLSVLFGPEKMAVRWSEKLIDDPALVVRTQAVKNLIHLHADSARDIMWKAIHSKVNFRRHQSLWIRPHMAKALAFWARPGQENKFLKLLEDSDPGVRKWAVIGMERSTGLHLGHKGDSLQAKVDLWLARYKHIEI